MKFDYNRETSIIEFVETKKLSLGNKPKHYSRHLRTWTQSYHTTNTH